VGLLAQVATNYLDLRGVQQRTGILRENINIQRERLRTVQAFNRAGLINQLDIARQKTLLHTTESALPVLSATAANLINRLAVLLGEPPENLESRLAEADPCLQNRRASFGCYLRACWNKGRICAWRKPKSARWRLASARRGPICCQSWCCRLAASKDRVDVKDGTRVSRHCLSVHVLFRSVPSLPG
jgi:hypothetical protein